MNPITNLNRKRFEKDELSAPVQKSAKWESREILEAPFDENEFNNFLKIEQKKLFEFNYSFLLTLTKENANKVKVLRGRFKLMSGAVSNNLYKKTLELIGQTSRQALGRLVEARYGLSSLLDELQRLNKLKDQILKLFPEAVPKNDLDKALSVFTSGYNRSSEIAHPALKEKRLIEQKFIMKNFKQKREGLAFENLDSRVSGINTTRFIVNKSNNEKLVLEKHEIENGMVFFWHEAYAIPKEKLNFVGGFNEILMSNLNILMEGRLGIPLAVKTVSATKHAFVSNIGNLSECLSGPFSSDHVNFLKKMPLVSAQQMVFAQLISGNSDCHAKNILITPNFDPVPIDFGRILTEPDDLRAAYLAFPCLDQEINQEDQSFYKRLNVEDVLVKLRSSLEVQYKKQFNDPQTCKGITTILEMLRARLYMIKMGVKSGLNQRQLIALNLPPLSEEMKSSFDKWKNTLLNQRLMSNGAPLSWKKTVEAFYASECHQQFVQEGLKIGFLGAWSVAFDPVHCNLDAKKFRMSIKKEIERIKIMDKTKIYGYEEHQIYKITNKDCTTYPLGFFWR